MILKLRTQEEPTCMQTQIKQMRTERTMLYALRIMPIFLVFFCLLLPSSALYPFEIPLDIHGRVFLGKYLNSDTIRYYMDATMDVSFFVLRHEDFSFFIRYRNDLEMAKQQGGVILDPRYVHYYIIGGFDYIYRHFLFATYFIHDCYHDIDRDVEGTPVFNRIRFQVASSDFHLTKRLRTTKKFLWSLDIGLYPHWLYHGWDLNAGADYKYDVVIDLVFTVLRNKHFGVDLYPTFQIAKGDTSFYHQHVARLKTYYINNNRRIGIGLDYNIKNNDPLRSPDKLWLFSIFVEF